MLAEALNQFVRSNFDAEVDDRIAVIAENDLDEVLADIVDIAFDSGEHNFAAGRAYRPSP